MEPAAQGWLCYTQPACRQVVAQSLEAAKDHRSAESLRQSGDLVLDDCFHGRGFGDRTDRAGDFNVRLDFASLAPNRPVACPPRHAPGYSMEPGPDRVAALDRTGLTHEDQKSGLKGVVGLVRV